MMQSISISSQEARVESINVFFRKVYGWMTVGLILTAVAAHWVASDMSLLRSVAGSIWLLLLVEVGLVFGLSMGINRISAGVATGLFVAYSILNGVTLSIVLMVYTRESVFSAFLSTAGMFGGMSLYGLYTQRDLTEWGSFLYMGLIGLIIGGLVNMFLASSMMDFVISLMGIGIFLGLTAYDTQYLRNLGGQIDAESGSPAVQKQAIIGALKLYLDFVNLFLYLLRLFGKRRN